MISGSLLSGAGSAMQTQELIYDLSHAQMPLTKRIQLILKPCNPIIHPPRWSYPGSWLGNIVLPRLNIRRLTGAVAKRRVSQK